MGTISECQNKKYDETGNVCIIETSENEGRVSAKRIRSKVVLEYENKDNVVVSHGEPAQYDVDQYVQRLKDECSDLSWRMDRVENLEEFGDGVKSSKEGAIEPASPLRNEF